VLKQQTMNTPVEHRPVLEVAGFSLKFSRDVNVPNLVDDVSLAVNAGETLCIVGESGCGKSVTSLALMGLLPSPPANIVAGTAMFDGRDLLKLSERELADVRGNRMSMIFQEPMTSLNPAFTVGHQIAECVARHRGLARAEARAEALAMLRLVRIPAPETRLDAYPHELSGGMRQRVMIAMALALRPQLMVMDEPTTALDVLVQREILKQISQLRHEFGFSVIFITHDLPLLLEISDRIAVMRDGLIVELDDALTLYTRPQHPYTKRLLSSFPSLTGDRGGFVRTGAIDEEAG